MVLNRGAVNIMEDIAKDIQSQLVLSEEPNVYEYASVKAILEEKGFRLEFNKKLTMVKNSFGNSWEGFTMESVLQYNVVEKQEEKILQFEIDEPTNMSDKIEYMKFLRTIFWELWEELEKSTVLKDYVSSNEVFINEKRFSSFFSRAMILPLDKIMSTLDSKSKKYNSFQWAKWFNVSYVVVQARLRDYDLIMPE